MQRRHESAARLRRPGDDPEGRLDAIGGTLNLCDHRAAATFPEARELLERRNVGLAARVAEAAGGAADPVQRMRTAVMAFLDTCTEPAYARLVLEEALAVLGWDTWREIDDRHFLGMTRGAVEQLMERGLIPKVDAGTLAHLLMATWTEAALLLSRSRSPATRERVLSAVDALTNGLLHSDAQAGRIRLSSPPARCRKRLPAGIDPSRGPAPR